MAVVAFQRDGDRRWMRCVNCSVGVVENEGVNSPAPKPLTVPLGLSGDELAAWTEVRECLAVGANTAAVMMCRKLLLHVAVSNGLHVATFTEQLLKLTYEMQALIDAGQESPVITPETIGPDQTLSV